MKLMTVLMLVALPLSCYAGSGCQLLEDIISGTLDPELSVEDFQELVKDFVHSELAKKAVGEFKQCFLNQSNETLLNVGVMMETIYSSSYCQHY